LLRTARSVIVRAASTPIMTRETILQAFAFYRHASAADRAEMLRFAIDAELPSVASGSRRDAALRAVRGVAVRCIRIAVLDERTLLDVTRDASPAIF
jgi:hypothetical protein